MSKNLFGPVSQSIEKDQIDGIKLLSSEVELVTSPVNKTSKRLEVGNHDFLNSGSTVSFA